MSLRRYDVQHDGQWCGTFVLTGDGIMFANTEFGSYANHWGRGCFSGDFRAFLANCDAEYVLGKVADDSWYDAEATVRCIKQSIILARRVDSISKDRARREFDLLADGLPDTLAFRDWCEATRLGDASEYARYGHNPDARRFGERIWPLFVAALKAETAREAAT